MNAPVDLIVPENFIRATRDSGYKSLGSALAELVDNAFEAEATRVNISLEIDRDAHQSTVVVADNGLGMDRETLRNSLRFGWSSRFNERNSHGRYGMGLPNASLSQARRVEVWSAQKGQAPYCSHLDIDDVINNGVTIAPARLVPSHQFSRYALDNYGTVVIWRNCDRLLNRRLGPLSRKVRNELGRLFRYQLWAGKQIMVNGERVEAFDPLFVGAGTNLRGAQRVGTEMVYEVELPSGGARKSSTIRVLFTELPIRHWHSLSNGEKNERGIAKNAGVSIVRAGREIDRGWFFMGRKRKENYDDWWRCEVRFEPDLDELFGVTHTKQEIRPTEKLLEVLVPDIERIAWRLNTNARRTFVEIKANASLRHSERVAEAHDSRLEPPRAKATSKRPRLDLKRGLRGRIGGLEYRLHFDALADGSLYEPLLDGRRVNVRLNDAHPAIQSLFHSNLTNDPLTSRMQRDVELLIIAASRAELIFTNHQKAHNWIKKFRHTWSNTLAAFLA